jgi:hypothetical protein
VDGPAKSFEADAGFNNQCPCVYIRHIQKHLISQINVKTPGLQNSNTKHLMCISTAREEVDLFGLSSSLHRILNKIIGDDHP